MQRVLTQTNEDANARRVRIAALLLFAVGLLLRIYFLLRRPFIASDSLLYQDIAQNWLHAHIYGLSTGVPPRPTLIRLPGYPAILAACSWLFDRWLHPDIGTIRSFLPVLWLQVFIDLATCWLVSRIARRLFGIRAGIAALALACLCPFTANYVAVPLTETCTLFFLALAFDTLAIWLDKPSTPRLVLIAVALSASTLLRPDQGLLAVCILPALLAAKPGSLKQRLAPVLLCAMLAALPFVPWTLRNLHTFHVLQPLAPKLANDPGEVSPTSFQRWFRTWAIDFSATQDAYWNYPEEPVLIDDLPTRAFDSPAQRDQTAALLNRAAAIHRLDPAVEDEFRALAAERIQAHPIRYYAVLPAARLLDMCLYPRIEMLPVAERWWQFHSHPKQTLLALLYAALNLAYFVAALAGLPETLRANRTLTLSMAAYVVLRCALLLTLDNPEQRYTLEFFPILIVLAAALFREKRPA
jgi:hypothetical protein